MSVSSDRCYGTCQEKASSSSGILARASAYYESVYKVVEPFYETSDATKKDIVSNIKQIETGGISQEAVENIVADYVAEHKDELKGDDGELKYLHFEIDENGHLICYADNSDALTFAMQNGRLEVIINE